MRAVTFRRDTQRVRFFHSPIMSTKKMLSIGAIVVAIFIGAVALLTRNTAPSPYTAFAQCLTDKGVAMYGAWWCPHCQNQKKLFGDAFKKITYIECADPSNPNGQTLACDEKKIQSYPTWIFADGSRIEGEASFVALKDKTQCPLP